MIHEPFALFSFLAGVAPRLGFAPCVIILPQRQTALVAKQAAQVDVLTNGKFRLGVGIGWNPVEFEGLGMNFRDRARRFEEQFDLMRRLWTEPVITYQGTYHTVTAAGINPLPVQRPIPIWVGASAEAAVRRACRIADGYMPLRPLEGGWVATMEKVRSWLREAGRDPASFGIETRINAQAGTPDEWRKELEQWRELGVSHVTVGTGGGGLGGPDGHVRRLRQVRELLGS
jgi:probable F420-dependent oxidoreductase